MARGHTEGTPEPSPDFAGYPPAGAVRGEGHPPGVLTKILRESMLEIARRFKEAAELPDDTAVSAHLGPVEEDIRQVLEWTKRAGRPEALPGETAGERRQRLRDEGYSIKDIARKDRASEEAVRKSLTPGRNRTKRGQ